MSHNYELHFEPWVPYRPLVTITKEDMAVINIYHKAEWGAARMVYIPADLAINIKVEAMQVADDFLLELVTS